MLNKENRCLNTEPPYPRMWSRKTEIKVAEIDAPLCVGINTQRSTKKNSRSFHEAYYNKGFGKSMSSVEISQTDCCRLNPLFLPTNKNL